MRPLKFLMVWVGVLYGAYVLAGDSPDDVKGLWMTAEKDAVLQLGGCPSKADALCGHIIWVKDADSTGDCGVQILQLDSYDGSAWRNGWVYDPRDHKKYKGVVRIKDSLLNMRAYVGTEVLGKTEQFERVEKLPPTQVCKS